MNYVWINDVLVAGARALPRSRNSRYAQGTPNWPGEAPMIEQDVIVNTKYGRQPAFAACPEAPGQYPGIILYMDAPGFSRRVARHGQSASPTTGISAWCRICTTGSARCASTFPRRNEAMSGVIRGAMLSLTNTALPRIPPA